MVKLVSSLQEARKNIRSYSVRITRDQQLRERAAYVRAWYADHDVNGGWMFAPSKWVGYARPSDYLAESGNTGQRDGRETEHVLQQWYQVVEPTDRLHGELLAALRSFLAGFDQVANKAARINKPRGGFEGRAAERTAEDQGRLLERITSDPSICGGRPIIRGTRMRVSDVLELLAHGATREEILHDYDYINDDDITAALLYAAHSSGYRTIRAA